jgi:hypothetical protein
VEKQVQKAAFPLVVARNRVVVCHREQVQAVVVVYRERCVRERVRFDRARFIPHSVDSDAWGGRW